MSESIKLKLAIFMLAWSKKTIRSEHAKTVGNDIKCPNCNEWFSVSGVDHNHEKIPNLLSHIFKAKCGKCGHVSSWNIEIAPVPILVKDGDQ